MLLLLIFVIILKTLLLKTNGFNTKKILKTKQKFVYVKLQYKLFYSKQLFFNFIARDLIKTMSYSKLKNIDDVLTKVKINIPQTYGKFVDRKCLSMCGLKEKIPIYIANKNEIKYIYEAMKYAKFYCILFEDCEIKSTEYIKIFNKDSISLELLNTLYLLNINYGKVCKTHLFENFDEIEINDKQLDKVEFFDGKFLCFRYSLCNIDIEIKKYYNDGLFYNIKIKNNCNQTKGVTVKINKNIDLDIINYYIFKTSNKTLKMFELSGQVNCFVMSNTKVEFIVSKVKELLNSNIPTLSIANNIKLQPYQIYEYDLFISKKHCKEFSFKKNVIEYITKLGQRFKVKIKSQNKKIDRLFNKILPQNIILDEIYQTNEKSIEINNSQCFEEVLKMYSSKEITNIKMYEYMLENYIGLKETSSLYILNPKTGFDFCLYIENKMIDIKYCGGKKYIEIDGTRYFNVSCILKNSFLLSSKILLVI